jgi:hypothetical protein
MNTFSILLQEIIDAGSNSDFKLNMQDWFCGTSCCACGDVALKRHSESNLDDILSKSNSFSFMNYDAISSKAYSFSLDLRVECASVFSEEASCLAESVYMTDSFRRFKEAHMSNKLSAEELEHPHLTTEHSSREILHDYIRVLIKISEKETMSNE